MPILDKMNSECDIMLLTILTVLSFVSASLSILLKPLFMCFFNASSEERKIQGEIINYKLEQSKISMQDNFVTHAKLQRKINKLEDSLKILSQKRVGQKLKYKYFITYSLQILVGFSLFAIAYWHRHTSMYKLEQNLFPFQNFLNYPINVPNTISPYTWVILSRVSFSLLLK